MPTPNEQQEQRAQLQSAIAGLEAQRALLGDAVVETALAALRQKLAQLTELADVQRPVIPAAPPLSALSLWNRPSPRGTQGRRILPSSI